MRISDWSSDVCSSDLIEQAGEPAVEFFPAQLVHVRRALAARAHDPGVPQHAEMMRHTGLGPASVERRAARLALAVELAHDVEAHRSEEQTSDLPSLMPISYAVFCLTNKNIQSPHK